MEDTTTSGFKHKKQNARGRFRQNQYVSMVILSMTVGTLGGFGAVIFRLMIKFSQNLFFGTTGSVLEAAQAIPWFKLILIPAAGGCLVGPIVYFFAREAKGHGVPEVIENVALRGGKIRKRVVAAKSVASAICIGSGGSAGREGPIVQIASALGSTIGQILNVSKERLRILVGCGAAAGIAATFNAPIAGCLFSLEVILGDFGIGNFGPVVLSSVMATVVSHAFLGDLPAFFVPPYKFVSAWEIPPYMVLGIIAGLAGFFFTRSLYWVEDRFDMIPVPEWSKAAIGGILIGIIGIFFPHVFGVGYESISLVLSEELACWMMLLLAFAKIAATSITLGSGGSGGIFAPSLFIGSMTGGAFGALVHHIWPEHMASSGAYAIVGMGAVVAGATHAPLTAIIILFEMTGDYKIILPLMLSCIISTLLTTTLSRESIYTLKLVRRGIQIKAGREENILRSIKVKDCMATDVELIPENMVLKDLLDLTLKSRHMSFPVVDGAGKLIGIISFDDFKEIAFEPGLEYLIVAKEIANLNVATITPEDDLNKAMRKLGTQRTDILPVVEKEGDGRIVGVVSRRDIMAAYNKALVDRSLKGLPS